MKKLSPILLGIMLIIALSFITFLAIFTSIKNDLISKAEAIHYDENIKGVGVHLKGENLGIQRVLVLTGTVSTDAQKSKAGTLAENVEGVLSVENHITVQAVEHAKATVIKEVQPVKQTVQEHVNVTSTKNAASEVTESVVNLVTDVSSEVSIPIDTVAVPEVIKSMVSIPIDAIETATDITRSFKDIIVPKAIKNTVEIPSVPVPVNPVAVISVEEVKKTEIKGVK